ncbi:MAG: Gx transporter family protein [Thermotogota bacterium]
MDIGRGERSFSSAKLTYLSVLTAIAISIGILETIIPPPVPLVGFKWGFSNSIMVMILMLMGEKEALTAAILKVTIVNLLTGRFFGPSFFLGLGGSLSSVYVMSILMKRKFGLIAVSVFGSFVSNLVQLFLAATLFVGSVKVFYLAGYIIGIGAFTGFLNAMIAYWGIKWMKKIDILS